MGVIKKLHDHIVHFVHFFHDLDNMDIWTLQKNPFFSYVGFNPTAPKR